MVSFGGLSAIPQGFETGIQGRERELDLQGTQAFGRALQLMFSGGQGGQAPIPPPPGQASLSAGAPTGPQPGMTPLPPWSQGGPGPPGGPSPVSAAPQPPGFDQRFAAMNAPTSGAFPGATPVRTIPISMPGGPQPAGPTPAPQPQQTGGGGPSGAPPMMPGMPQGGQQGPAMDLQSVIGAIVKSNPGANPAVIASAVNRFIPLMNAQSQQQWREMTLQLREQAIQQAEYFKWVTANQKQEGLDIAKQRADEQAKRDEQAYQHKGVVEQQGQQRIDIAKGESARKKEQGDARTEQARQRLEIAKQDLQRKFAADAEKKKVGEGRLAIAQKQYDLAVQRNDLAGQRAAIQAMHLRAAEIIQEWAAGANVDQEFVDKLLEENRKYYREKSDAVGKPQAPKTPDRAPAGTVIPGQQPEIPQ